MEPGYKVTSRQHLTTTCRRLYGSLKENLLDTLSLKYVAVTTDLWTSRATESYLTVTAHFLNSEWSLQSKVLLTQEMSERHTGKNIAERLREAVQKWTINELYIIAIVRDNARNMDIAVTELGWDDVPCFAHTLQLAVRSGLEQSQIAKLVAVGRKLVGHFKHSAVAMTSLKAKQENMNLPQHHLIQDVPRWNSTFYMME